MHLGRSPSPDVLDYILFLPGIWLACALGISLRLIGPLFVVVPVGVCLAYAVLRQTAPPRLLAIYTAFCVFIALLSRYRLMPDSWQVHFLQEAVIRQLVPTVGFFSVAWASKAYFRRRLIGGTPFFSAPVFLFLSLVVGPAVMFQQGVQYQGAAPASAVLYLYGSFINNIVTAMFFIAGAVFLTNDWRRYGGLLLILGIALVSPFAQFRVLAVTIIAMLVGIPGRLVAICLVTTMVAAYAVGLNFIPQTLTLDANSGIRLVFISDTLASVADTYGIGIGFGKESVQWRYEFPGFADFTFLPDIRNITHARLLEILSVGIHNSFFQSMLRTGVIGFVLIVSAISAAFPPPRLPRGVRDHASALFVIIFLAMFVNPALESPIQIVGIAFVYGYLIALRASARAESVESVPARPLRSRIPLVAHLSERECGAPATGDLPGSVEEERAVPALEGISKMPKADFEAREAQEPPADVSALQGPG
ncbi:hypothetical protein AU381_10830 [Sinorhizobium glycinis]|uniref:Uncharacterized protein n=1 Tax=Sinorhizobium glycinis TaxID=1472378 RepID=A0A178XY21_9HYPH|nr:hypothetical protein AU381_10830 [Sinorhizobium glycinis]